MYNEIWGLVKSTVRHILGFYEMEKTSRICAYCGLKDNLSREHIFPSGIIEKYDEKLLSYNDKSDFLFKSDLVVKDVCEKCNNGALSKLDNYLCSVYEKQMKAPISPGDCVELNYDYHPLLRSLIKISFNSARASSDGSKAIKVYKNLVPYLLGQKATAPGVMLRLQIVTSANKVNKFTGMNEGVVESKLLRSAKIAYDGLLASRFIIRLVALNSFWFYLIVPTLPVSQAKRNKFLEEFCSWRIPAGVAVSPNNHNLMVPVEKTTYIHQSLFEGVLGKSLTSR